VSDKEAAMTVVVLDHGVRRDHLGSIHLDGCRDVPREGKKLRSKVYGRFESVEVALSVFIDAEMESRGYSHDDVKVHACCKAAS
jgi:hypothetical protein